MNIHLHKPGGAFYCHFATKSTLGFFFSISSINLSHSFTFIGSSEASGSSCGKKPCAAKATSFENGVRPTTFPAVQTPGPHHNTHEIAFNECTLSIYFLQQLLVLLSQLFRLCSSSRRRHVEPRRCCALRLWWTFICGECFVCIFAKLCGCYST